MIGKPGDQLPAVDQAGNSGLQDRVDWHWGRLFSGAALSTILGVGAEVAAPDRRDSEGRVVIATRDGLRDTVNELGQQITKRNLDVQPTISIRAGYRLNVIVNSDLALKPYQPSTEDAP